MTTLDLETWRSQEAKASGILYPSITLVALLTHSFGINMLSDPKEVSPPTPTSFLSNHSIRVAGLYPVQELFGEYSSLGSSGST